MSGEEALELENHSPGGAANGELDTGARHVVGDAPHDVIQQRGRRPRVPLRACMNADLPGSNEDMP